MHRALLLFVLFTSLAAEAPKLAPPYEDALGAGEDAERKGLIGKALNEYAKAMKLDPKRPEAYFGSGRALSRQQKHEEAVAMLDKAIEIEGKDSRMYQLRGVEHFRLAQPEKAVEDFDRYLALEPAMAPQHWQRGIALYYAGKYDLGRKQFETHQTVNSHDVENAVWHFICVTRAENFEKARAGLIPISGDSRVPMAEVFKLFAGKGTVEDVMAAVKKGTPTPVELENRAFFAHLYLGLYFEAKGDAKQAYDHMKLAATEFAQDHYMGDVAKVHFKLMLKNPPK